MSRMLLNLNKVFPRLSIRAKLIIAFAGLSVVPLVGASVLGALITVNAIRQSATARLTQDLDKAEAQTARSLREAERHVRFLSREILIPALLADSATRWRAAHAAVASFLGPEPAFHAIKVVDQYGRLRFASTTVADSGGDESGVYYAWRAAVTAAGTGSLFPIEVREADSSGAVERATPAIAILVPVRDVNGALIGAVIGEAYASEIFAAIESASPGFEGVTGLVDRHGAFLYHSARQQPWASRLVAGADSGLESDVGAGAAVAVLGGRAGTTRSGGRDIVGFRPLTLGTGAEPLAVYRVLPHARLERPVRRFLVGVLLAATLVVVVVLVLGIVAADQFTRPIYRLRSAARTLAAGGTPPPLEIETNDEIEDLSGDFERMGREIGEHRDRLQQLVAERTRDLEATHAVLSTVLEGSADAIIGLDPDGAVRLWNHGAVRLFGWDEAGVLGRNLNELIGPSGPDGERELAYIDRVLEDEGALVGFPTMRRTVDGTRLPVNLTQTVLGDHAGGPLGTSLIIRDNRAQMRLDDHMRRSERLATVAVMAAGLAHEIRNPLGIVANRIEVMQRDAADRHDATLSRDFETLAAHVERLRRLTTDLLRFARDEGDTFGPVHLDVVAARITALLQPTFVTRNIALHCVADGAIGVISASEGAIETVILNLLLNAADATPSGGSVGIVVRPLRGRDAIEVEVRDEGAGISPEVRSRIFEPFFTTKGSRGGTGLGLAVCRAVVERHAGTIAVASAPGAGSVFTVVLPLHAAGGA